MTLRIAICDDISAHSAYLQEMLLKARAAESAGIAVFSRPQALLEAMENGAAYDVLFLDVELGSESGIALARQINERYPGAQIIFVTANIINAIDIDEANHTYFLTKPVDAGKLDRALGRALAGLSASTDKRLKLPLCGGTEALLAAGQIVYCERKKRTTTLVCTAETLESPAKLDALEEELPARMFARPHTSFLVNLTHVSRVERSCVHLDNGAVLSISNQRRNGFREAIAAFVTNAG